MSRIYITFIVLLTLFTNVSHCVNQYTQLHSEILKLKDQVAGLEVMRNDIIRLKEENAAQEAEIDQLKNNCLNGKETNLQKIKRLLIANSQSPSSHVAFYAHLTKNIDNLGNHQPIVFDTVKTNQGNAYKAVDGEFAAKIAGTYFFIWTISNGDATYMTSELVVNGQVFGQIFSDAGSHRDWAVSTAFTIVSLKPEDRVWIRSGTVHSGHVNGAGYGTSSFAGFLLW